MFASRQLLLKLGASALFAIILATQPSFADPKLDTTTDESFRHSLSEVRESLSPHDKTSFEAAIKILAFSLIDFEDIGRPQDVVFPEMLQNLKRLLDNKTGAEVLAIAANTPINMPTIASMLANAVRGKNSNSHENSVDFDAQARAPKLPDANHSIQASPESARKPQISALNAPNSNGDSGAKVLLGKSEYTLFDGWQPRLKLSVTNRTPHPISGLLLETVVRVPGRTIPWHEGQASGSIPGGIEPNETRIVSLRMVNGWPIDVPNNAVWEFEVIELYGVDDKVISSRETRANQ